MQPRTNLDSGTKAEEAVATAGDSVQEEAQRSVHRGGGPPTVQPPAPSPDASGSPGAVEATVFLRGLPLDVLQYEVQV